MRRAVVLLATLFVCAACTTEPETTIQVQGTVTARDDGSPIVGATVTVSETSLTSVRLLARVETNNQGDYSLSFTGCSPSSVLSIVASAVGFHSVVFFSSSQDDAISVRCTEEPQTIDFQLERDPG